jgi:hypothetical protein
MVESGGLLGGGANHAQPARRRSAIALAIIAASVCIVSVVSLSGAPDFSVRKAVLKFYPNLAQTHQNFFFADGSVVWKRHRSDK